MKSKLLKLTITFPLIFFISCSKKQQDSLESLVSENFPEEETLISSENEVEVVNEDIDEEITEIVEISEIDSDEDIEEIISEISKIEISEDVHEEDVVMVAQEYSFIDGKCVNENGDEGYNNEYFGECGDLSYQNLDELDFSNAKDIFGLNIEGAYITNSNIDVETIVFFEMKFNEDTQIAGISNLETKVLNEYIQQKNQINKWLYIKLKIIEKLRDLISKLIESGNPKYEKQLIQKQKLLDSKLKKYYADLEKVNRLQAYIDSQEN